MLTENWCLALLVFGFFAVIYTWAVTIVYYIKNISKKWRLSIYIIYGFLITAAILCVGIADGYTSQLKRANGATIAKFTFYIMFMILAYSNFVAFTIITILRATNRYIAAKNSRN
ncbi:hypothetical protein [Metamycoplasma equirhinis]|uniref:Uncharacterized protein n=1 Tax=Metamycoplasma equirhinis TaxID=92402 RepID=A0ABZ0PAZ5_9BACT|nr:hypothetical protein [Metamycoplasma equirhinis]TPD98878.1 hypothetical protein FJM08_01415 [Metamycoplasma equirhinis]WPB54045.1 hypothetical protein R9B83_00505 [Metamycoplasma equirhinis]